MSRREREEIPFGSDSFLDVLANIVGILIILIVAAAARMGRDPVQVSHVVLEPSETKTAPAAAVVVPPDPRSSNCPPRRRPRPSRSNSKPTSPRPNWTTSRNVSRPWMRKPKSPTPSCKN